MLPKNRATRRALRAVFIAAAAPSFAHAANDLWNVAASGVWSTPGNWSLGVVPGNNDNAFLHDPGVNPITITFDASAVATNLANVWVDSSGTSLVTFSQSLNTLTVATEIVGSNGAGLLVFNGGTQSVTTLTIGNLATGNGTMNFGGGVLNVTQFNDGIAGTGVVNQSGGTANITSFLAIGQSTNNSTYNLTNGTINNTGVAEHIGFGGVATFNQSGGLNSLGSNGILDLGSNTGTFGTYNLSNGATLSIIGVFSSAELVGGSGAGVFNQTGGTHSIPNGTLVIGSNGGASGTMNLSGGTLNALGLTVGFSGKGAFNQTGGTATVGTLVLGSGTGSGSFGLSNSASFTVSNSATIGASGMGSYTQSGGTFALQSTSQTLTLGASAGSSGTANLSGGLFNVPGTLMVGAAGNGFINHTGGSVTVNLLTLGGAAGGSGTYALSGSGNLLSNFGETIGGTSRGVFTQSGGSNNTFTLTLASTTNGTGMYSLSAGNLVATNQVTVGASGAGTFSHTGGSVQAGRLTLGSSFNTNFLGTLLNSFQGAYALSAGATLNISGFEAIGNAGSGFFLQNGGSHTANILSLGNLATTNNASVSSSFTLADGTLAVQQLQVALETSGTFLQTGGTNIVNGPVFIADGTLSSLSSNAQFNGTYEQQGGVAIFNNQERVGGRGVGALNISGGSHTDVDLDLGYGNPTDPFGQGVLLLSGGALNVTSFEVVGFTGLGSMTQFGGSNTAQTLYVAFQAGATGSATLTGGTLNILGDEIVGFGANGSVAQSGGLHTVGRLLTIQSPTSTTSSGLFTLTGGTLTAAVANFGTMTIGGSANFNGSLTNSGTLILNTSTGTVSAAIVNQGSITVNSDFTFAGGFEQDGDPITIGGHILLFNGTGLNNFSTFTLANGKLGGSDPILNNGQISGFGTLTGTGGIINNGNLSVTGGTLIVADPLLNVGNLSIDAGQSLRLTSPLTNTGSITFNSASFINGTALLTNNPGGIITGPGLITAPLANAGTLSIPTGALNVTQPFANSGIINLTSISAGLSGGGVTNTGTIQGVGSISSHILNQGTIEAVGGTLSIANATNSASGILRVATGNKLLLTPLGTATNAGTISLVGGTFDTNGKPLVNAGTIAGYGTLATGGLTNASGQAISLTGGFTTVNGSVNNAAGGTIRVLYTPAIFTQPVTNSGTIKITSTTVTFATPFTNNGLYTSDPAVTHYSDVTIGAAGALAGGAGDQFFVSGDFRSNSIQRLTWNTVDGAELHFESGGVANHVVTLTGSDLGPAAAGYHDNFAWGILTLDPGQSLTLADGDTTPGGALYTSILQLAGAPTDAALPAFIASHIINSNSALPIDIYYDPAQPANAYLQGDTYPLGNGGVLAAVTSVPEPGIAIAFSAAALLSRRRRKR